MLKQGMRDYEKARFLLSNSNISEDVKENLRNSIKVDLPIGGNNGYGSKTYQNQEERMRVHNQTTLAYDKINEVAIKHLELIHPLVNRDLLREKVESITAELLGEDREFTEETKAKYTEVSLNNLKEKLDIAKEVLINDDVEQNQVDVALSNLNSAYVELELIPDVQPEIQNTKGFIIGTTNIRVEPNGPIIGTLKKGEIVEGQYKEGSNWVKFDYNGQEAYVYKPLISDTIEVKGLTSGYCNTRKFQMEK